ncbi:protein toll-like [Achroia grisella]|uniref:protein toll-like n=1 Tax=Achroia grisella TaxID=688607 RepID=UPI0027D2AE96|nr:protein toll-like [Achroia grisella]
MMCRTMTMPPCYMVVMLALLAGVRSTPLDSLRPVCPPTAQQNCTYEQSSTSYEHFYSINGNNVRIIFKDGDFFKLICNNIKLDKSILPSFARHVVVHTVTFKKCPPPDISYAELFAALNVSKPRELVLSNVPPEPRLRASHFIDITLERLEIEARRNASQKLDAELLSLLDGGPGKLYLTNVKLDRLPVGRRDLRVTNAGIESLPIEALEKLETLHLDEPYLTDVRNLSEAPLLSKLSLTAPVREAPSPPRLSDLFLSLWQEARPGRRRGCGRLRALTVTSAAARRLPAAWLANCSLLRNLTLQRLTWLEELPSDLLRDAANLTRLTMQSCNLEALPEEFFSFSSNLRVVNLNYNRLKTLPSKISSLQQLEELSLLHNSLTYEIAPVLAPLTSLRRLVLSMNPLGDLCGARPAPGLAAALDIRDQSPLAALGRLEVLELARVNASRVCRDWVEAMPHLRQLDLSGNRVTELTYEDLQARRDPTKSLVNLRRNPIERILYDKSQYERVISEPTHMVARVEIDSQLTCDCQLYYFARALREKPAHVNINSRTCRDGRPLAERALDDLACRLPAADCWPACRCELRPALGGECGPACGLRAECGAPPVGPGPPALRRLRLAELGLRGAGLAALPPAAALPRGLRLLDARDNRVEGADAAAAAALLAPPLRLRLAGNPLRCECGRRALVDALLDRADRVEDLAHVACADGGPLVRRACGPAPAALAALVALSAAALAAAALAALLARAEPRLRLKAWLYARGLLPCAAREEEAGRPFDAFVSYAEEDERFVAERLAARLEAGARPLRLCLRYREWAAGAWMPAQLAASLARSRRWLVVVSARLPRSAWARAELRAAHAAGLRSARPRLVAVLVGAPPLDAELRRLLSAATLLRWEDPWFWEKLLYAMPRPRKRPRPGPAPHQPPAPRPAAAPPAA